MEIRPLGTIIAELASDDWLVAGSAIRKLVPHGEAAAAALPALFELTFHEKAPVSSDSRRLITRLGKHAVPFLRDQAAAPSPHHREMAIALLTETGSRWATTTRLLEQVLDTRRTDLPDWGTATEDIIRLFRSSLSDESLSVRFNAACALEEFGRHLLETVPVFIESLQDGTSSQQNWAALHLGRLGQSAAAATHALEMASRSQCEATALAASNALQRIRRSEEAC